LFVLWRLLEIMHYFYLSAITDPGLIVRHYT